MRGNKDTSAFWSFFVAVIYNWESCPNYMIISWPLVTAVVSQYYCFKDNASCSFSVFFLTLMSWILLITDPFLLLFCLASFFVCCSFFLANNVSYYCRKTNTWNMKALLILVFVTEVVQTRAKGLFHNIYSPCP